jgi:hypothetical protein
MLPYLHTTHKTRPHYLSEKSNTLFLSNFGRIFAQATFFANVTSCDIMGTTSGVVASKTGNFEAKKCSWTRLLTVGTRLDSYWCARATSGKALRSIMVTLPQLVLGHVATQCLVPSHPLGTTGTSCGKTAREWTLTGCAHHSNLPTTTRPL